MKRYLETLLKYRLYEHTSLTCISNWQKSARIFSDVQVILETYDILEYVLMHEVILKSEQIFKMAEKCSPIQQTDSLDY